MIKSKREYHGAVKAALQHAGLPLSYETEAPAYENYLACADLVGDGEIVAERSPEGQVRIFVFAPRGAAPQKVELLGRVKPEETQ